VLLLAFLREVFALTIAGQAFHHLRHTPAPFRGIFLKIKFPSRDKVYFTE
jgi:hypothetical protein